jgi:hypothetical protein
MFKGTVSQKPLKQGGCLKGQLKKKSLKQGVILKGQLHKITETRSMLKGTASKNY